MSVLERRFITGFRTADSDQPGLIQEDDGTVWLIRPNGTRVQITGGGGTGLPAWWDVDEGQETVVIRGGLSILTENDIATLDIVNNTDDATESNVRLCATVESLCRANVSLLTEPDGLDTPHVTSRIIAQVVTPDGINFANLDLKMTMDGDDPVSSFQINHELISFRGDRTPIPTPEIDLSSPTLAEDLAQALDALGLVRIVP